MNSLKKISHNSIKDVLSDVVLLMAYYMIAYANHAYDSLCKVLCGKFWKYRNRQKLERYLYKYPKKTHNIVMTDERFKIESILKERYKYEKK